jgi:hypothetical protein
VRCIVIDRTIYNIFRRGSKTYFYSTLFFPPAVREDVFSLYSFVRTADDYVDAVPQQVDEFYAFTDRYATAAAGEATGDVVVDSFVELSGRKGFDPAWTEVFLLSMERDITVASYRTIRDIEAYLYGSSEVVGLMMARVLDLAPESYAAAQNLGRAMQYVNFIRDIAEDLTLGRTYFPAEERWMNSGSTTSRRQPPPGTPAGLRRSSGSSSPGTGRGRKRRRPVSPSFPGATGSRSGPRRTCTAGRPGRSSATRPSSTGGR